MFYVRTPDYVLPESRHLAGKHNQKDHGHGGRVDVAGPEHPHSRLTAEQYAAIQPGPGQTKAKALKALNATAEGQELVEAATLWQNDMSKVTVLQKNFTARSQGKKLSKKAEAQVTALMDGIRGGPISPSLHRGVRMPKGFDPRVDMKPGTSFILPPSSFSSSARVGRGFAKQRAVYSDSVPVVIRVKAARGLPVQVFGDSAYKGEKEWISAGKFTVSSVSRGSDGVFTVDVSHDAVFSW